MNSEKNIVKVLKNSLGFTNVQNLGDLGEMRQNTIETKIQKHRKKLTDINVASIYNAWLREQNCRLDKTKSDVVKAYCRFLESFRCQPPWIATMWDECTRGALKDAVNTDETERIERHMLKIRGEIEKYFGKSLFTGKGEWLPSAGTCLPVVASTTERTDKENPNPNTSSAPLQSSKVVSSFQKSHLTWMKAAQTNLGPRVSQTAPQPSLELKQRDQVVIDLAQDSWETSTPQPFALQHADELDETMPPPPSYVCHRCNCRGRYPLLLSERN